MFQKYSNWYMHRDCNTHRQLYIILTNLKGGKQDKFQFFPKYRTLKKYTIINND